MATVVGMLTGCGGKSEDKGVDAGGEEGKVINVYGWNDELRQHIKVIYPEVEKTSDDGTITTLKDETEIHWIVDPNQDGIHRQKLDGALMKQADAAEDGKIDILLSEIDYVNKYTDVEADAAAPLKDLGVDPDKDSADQYDSTKVAVSDAESVQRSPAWQCCPGLLVYRRDIAKKVFGADDPVIVGEKTNDWNTLKVTAGELATKGCFTFVPCTGTFRLYGSSVVQPWVASNETTTKVNGQIVSWIEDFKEWLDAQYFSKTVKGQWNDGWNKVMGSESKVFVFLLPAWGADFMLSPNWDGEAGAWAAITSPQKYNWGDSYTYAATGTDSTEHVKGIIPAVTADKDNLLKISKNYADLTNAKSGMREAAKDDNLASEFLGGQDSSVYHAPVAEKVKIASLSVYGQGCVELTQNSSSDYFQGKVDYDKAKASFETTIKEHHPNIAEIEWHE